VQFLSKIQTSLGNTQTETPHFQDFGKVRRKQVLVWSLTIPIACIKAYMMVGPTKRNPRFFMSLLIASDSGEVARIVSTSCALGDFTKPHKYFANDPNSFFTLSAHKALLRTDQIFNRCLTTLDLAKTFSSSRSVITAQRFMSKL